jgi:hypothetical protein
LSDTAQQVRAILSRTLRELDEAIENPRVSSVLSTLGSLLGLDDGHPPAAPAAQPSRKRGSGARRPASASARASAARKFAPAPARSRRSAPATDGTTSSQSGRSSPARKTRRDDLLALVREQPGVTLAQAARQFGLKDETSLYRVARRLQDEGLVEKTGPELRPAGNARKR